MFAISDIILVLLQIKFLTGQMGWLKQAEGGRTKTLLGRFPTNIGGCLWAIVLQLECAT